jgi:hypothetical protein
MYWSNPRSEFYGAKLDRLGPIRLRLTVAVFSVIDYIIERLTAGTIFNLLPDDFDPFDHGRRSGPKWSNAREIASNGVENDTISTE